MSTTAAALNELPRATPKLGANGLTNANTNANTTEPKSIADLGKNDKVVVNKVDNSNSKSGNEDVGDEFMAESEFGLDKPQNLNTVSRNSGTSPSGANTTTITVSTSNTKPTINMGTGPKLSDTSESDKLEDFKSGNTASNTASNKSELHQVRESKNGARNGLDNGLDNGLSESSENEIEEHELDKSESESEEENSAAELVAAAAAQIANKTLKKPSGQQTIKLGSKNIKTTGKLLASGKQEQIMKKAMLMMNESGRLNVLTDEPTHSIVKLNTPANKAQIKLRTFRQNFEKQLVEMRRKTPLQIQSLKAELANIEFAEIGNTNIMAGLLELIDDHELKMLTIEKMLKHGDITLSF